MKPITLMLHGQEEKKFIMSKLEIRGNPNYCASIVALTDVHHLDNCDNVVGANVFGNEIIVGKDTPVGTLGVFFPVETSISRDFLSANNLFRDSSQNIDKEAKGYFELHGRVKAVKFRGHHSDGFWTPIESLSYLGIPLDKFEEGQSFDTIDGKEICTKYAIISKNINSVNNPLNLEASFEDYQFRFHYKTQQLGKEVNKINEDDIISISEKWHGTSAIIGKLLIKNKLNVFERFLSKVGIVRPQKSHYGLTYSSRTVIRNIEGENDNKTPLFYENDIWGEVAEEIKRKIPNGFTIYGEIVGYTKSGSPIQNGYVYGCQPGEHKFMVYRVTATTEDGIVSELSWDAMKQFCLSKGLNTVVELFYGKVSEYYPEAGKDRNWRKGFMNKLYAQYLDDRMDPNNDNKVPFEGIVLRKDRWDCSLAMKYKNPAFLERESKNLDKGVSDMESDS